MNNPLSLSSSSSERTCHASEESSWTMYLGDFFANHNQDNHDSFIFYEETFPVVSDAASLVGKKSLESKPAIGLLSTNQKSYNNRFSFKKRRTKEAMVDDALEDTASSPANSPKVYDLNVQFKKNRTQKVELCTSQENSSALSKGRETGNLGFIGCENDTIELKKRDLCLVPVSMVVNFLGHEHNMDVGCIDRDEGQSCLCNLQHLRCMGCLWPEFMRERNHNHKDHLKF